METFSVKLGDLLAGSTKKDETKPEVKAKTHALKVHKKEDQPVVQRPRENVRKEVSMTQHKGNLNIQDQFLNHVRREKAPVTVHFVDGTTIQGHIKSFDNFCLQIESNSHGETLIYKHGISSITHSKVSDYSIKTEQV